MKRTGESGPNRSNLLTRRHFVLGGAAAAAASCRHPKAHGFPGFAFVANQEGRAIAAVDLTVFAVARHIGVEGSPTSVSTDTRTGRVYALTPENGMVHEIQAGKLAVSRKVQPAASAVNMLLDPTAGLLYLLCSRPKRVVALSLNLLKPEWQVPLPLAPFDFDLSRDGKWLAVSYGAGQALSILSIPDRKISAPIPVPGDVGILRFQSDSRQLIAANVSDRMLSVYQVASGRLVVNLPLAVRPDRFCFSSDGGQLFVTGEGTDGVAVVYPYYTPQVAETVLAGHAPGAMAASAGPGDGYLFVANQQSGDVSILDIHSRKLLAVTPVGSNPSYVTITPDNQYALVLNRTSGDMAVIRIPNITRTVNEQRRWRKGALFMLIPVGSKPTSAAVMAI